MTTPIFRITTHTKNENNAHVRANDAYAGVENSTQRDQTFTITGNRTLTIEEMGAAFVHIMAGTPTDFELTVPQEDRFFGISNKTNAIVTIKAAGGGQAVELEPQGFGTYWTDGVDVEAAGAGGGGGGAVGVLAAFRPTFGGALVRRSTDYNLPNNTNQIIDWDVEAYDQGNFFNPANPTRLTVPTGVTRVRVGVSIAHEANTGGTRRTRIFKNGVSTGFEGQAISEIPGSTAGFRSINPVWTPPIDVVAGDYFEAEVYQNSGTSPGIIENLLSNWFAIQVEEYVAQYPIMMMGGAADSLTMNTTGGLVKGYAESAVIDWPNDDPVDPTNGLITLPLEGLYRITALVLGNQGNNTKEEQMRLSLDVTGGGPNAGRYDIAYFEVPSDKTTRRFFSTTFSRTFEPGEILGLWLDATATMGTFTITATTFEVVRIASAGEIVPTV